MSRTAAALPPTTVVYAVFAGYRPVAVAADPRAAARARSSCAAAVGRPARGFNIQARTAGAFARAYPGPAARLTVEA
jgi:hypothetical protein